MIKPLNEDDHNEKFKPKKNSVFRNSTHMKKNTVFMKRNSAMKDKNSAMKDRNSPSKDLFMKKNSSLKSEIENE